MKRLLVALVAVAIMFAGVGATAAHRAGPHRAGPHRAPCSPPQLWIAASGVSNGTAWAQFGACGDANPADPNGMYYLYSFLYQDGQRSNWLEYNEAVCLTDACMAKSPAHPVANELERMSQVLANLPPGLWHFEIQLQRVLGGQTVTEIEFDFTK